MVSLTQIQGANRQRSSSPRTAVFVGATSGIGLGAIEALLRSIKGCTIFIIGRSESRFSPTLSKLQAIDPTANITFIEAQVSLLKETDRVSKTIQEQTTTLDILWLSQGGLGLRESNGFTIEDLPQDFAVSYYGRVLFMQRLAPLLSRSPDGRVLSVLSAGMEGLVNVSDPSLSQKGNYAAAGFWGAQRQGVTMQSLAMRQLAAQYSSVTFIHTNPGPTSTDVHAKWANSFTGVWVPLAWLIRFVMMPLFSLVGYSAEQAGETGMFALLDARFERECGKNFYRLDDHAEEVGKGREVLLERYAGNGMEEMIWEHTVGVFERVLGA